MRAENENAVEEKYIAAMKKLPPFKCGRLDMNTYMSEPVTVGRVTSDIVRYVYFEDGQEVIVLGQRADEVAYAASKYQALLTAAERVEELEALLREARRVTHEPNCGWRNIDNSDCDCGFVTINAKIDAALEARP